MSFSRSLVSSSILAGAVFCAATAPLAMLKSDAVTIQFGDEPIFVGQVEDVAVPYMGLAMAISFGVGAVHLSSLGWRQSSAKLSETQDEVTQLKQKLQEQTLRVDAVQFSDEKLEKAGLNPFIDPAKSQITQPVSPRPTSLPASSAPLMPMARAAASAMPAAQSFHGFSAPAPAAGSTLSASPQQGQLAQTQNLDDLMSQIKQVMAQVEKLQDQGVNAHAHIA